MTISKNTPVFFLAALVAMMILVPQAAFADFPGYAVSSGSKPAVSYSYSSGSKPTSATPIYSGYSYTKKPTYQYPSYSYTNTPSYYSSYSSCGYYYSCGGGGISLSYYDNNNSNSNSNYNYNYNSNYNNNGGGYDREPEPVCALSASDTSIEEGDSTTLHWTSEYAYSASLSGEGSVGTSGSRTVRPSSTRTYTLSVFGSTGGKDTCSVTVHVDEEEEDNDLWCELDVSDNRVEEGDEVTLEWDTRGADYASINQGVGRVDEDGGEEDVEVDNDTTFRLTVRNDDGDEETCSATVRVDEENDFSSVVYDDEPSQNPPPTVYLSSIPYTGLEDLTPDVLMYWLLLIAGIGALGWYAISKGLVPTTLFAFAHADGSEVEDEVAEEAPSTGHVSEFVARLAAKDEEAVMAALRTAAVDGTGVEEFLTEARATVALDSVLAAKLDAMIVGSRETGIRGAKAAFAA